MQTTINYEVADDKFTLQLLWKKLTKDGSHFARILGRPMGRFDSAFTTFRPALRQSSFRRTFSSPAQVSRGLRQAPLETGLSEVVNNDKEFCVNLDCRDFKPEEIEIKTKDNRLVIHAKHEEKQDEHGYIMREFTRNYVLPKDVDPEAVKSSLNDDGVLTLQAPKKALEPPKERAIPITHEKGDS